MYKFFLIIVYLLFSAQAMAEDKAIANFFNLHGIDGAIVISSLHSGQIFIHNDSRANRRFSPASTFKVLNTLISLEEKAILGGNDLLKWDGYHYDIPDWNHDQTLESAFKVSCVWCFQELARKVGADKYRNYLSKVTYGKLSEPFNETTFWLDGTLEISAVEQVEFLKKVYQRSLPFKPSTYETLRQIMIVEQKPTFTIRAKTGWATRVNPQVGWYVGYVETLSDVWFFAMNIEARDENDLAMRQKLTREALLEKGIIK